MSNTFASDGSFLERMLAMQQRGGGAGLVKGFSRTSSVAVPTVQSGPSKAAVQSKGSTDSVGRSAPRSRLKPQSGISMQLSKKKPGGMSVAEVFGDDDDEDEDVVKKKVYLPPRSNERLPPPPPPDSGLTNVPNLWNQARREVKDSLDSMPAWHKTEDTKTEFDAPLSYSSCPPPQDPLSRLKYGQTGQTGTFAPSTTAAGPLRKTIFSSSIATGSAHGATLADTAASYDNNASRKRRSRWGETPSANPSVPPPGVAVKLELGGTVSAFVPDSLAPTPASQGLWNAPSISSLPTIVPPPPQLTAAPHMESTGGLPLSAPAGVPQPVQPSATLLPSLDMTPEELKVMQAKLIAKQAIAKVEAQAIAMNKMKPKKEYDSDEETDGGTWEHKLRASEMEATKTVAKPRQAGKHHLNDYLPPELLTQYLPKRFRGDQPQEESATPVVRSDYEENKLDSSNLGFKLLQKMGWKEGKGLGSSEKGIVAPISAGQNSAEATGLGASSTQPSTEDDDFELYRKRMMLAYRHRPNPLNNPRRKYY